MAHLNRVHYNRCPECGEWLSQMGIQDGVGGWHGENIWVCTINSHLDDNGFAGRYRIFNKEFKRLPVNMLTWRSDATGEF